MGTSDSNLLQSQSNSQIHTNITLAKKSHLRYYADIATKNNTVLVRKSMDW